MTCWRCARGPKTSSCSGSRWCSRNAACCGTAAGGLPRARPLAAPEMSMRSYPDVVYLPGQVVVTQSNLPLPNMFRHSGRPACRTGTSKDVAPRFGRVDIDLERSLSCRHLLPPRKRVPGALRTSDDRAGLVPVALAAGAAGVSDLKVLVALSKQR